MPCNSDCPPEGHEENSSTKPISTEDDVFPKTCPLCKIICHDRIEYKRHRIGVMHRFKYITHWYTKNRPTLLANKNNVEVMVTNNSNQIQPSEEGRLEIALVSGQPFQLNLQVFNSRHNDKPVIFRGMDWLITAPEVETIAEDELGIISNKNVVLMPQDSIVDVTVMCRGNEDGAFTAALIFQFRFEDSENVFFIVRELVLHVQRDVEDMKLLMPTGPYKAGNKGQRKKEDLDLEIVQAPSPEFRSFNFLTQANLEYYDLPEEYKGFIAAGMKANNAMEYHDKKKLEKIKKLLTQGVTKDNYDNFFSTLLFIEEAKMLQDMRQYDQHKVILGTNPSSKFLTLEVPGLAEKRPSVMFGDTVYVRKWSGGNVERKEYEGRVEKVKESMVEVNFDAAFLRQHTPKLHVDVRFSFTRMSLRYQHRALEVAQDKGNLYDILFPKASSLGKMPLLCSPDEDLSPVNMTLKENKQQWQAVRYIVAGSSRPAAYLLFGPPGTGKTVTMVEAINQVLLRFKTAHLLVCGASNSASDLLAKHILESNCINEAELFRMHAISRDWNSVPDCLKKCSNYDDREKAYFYPEEKVIEKYRVIVATLVTAGRLFGASLPKHHFTHVFVDEGGQAMEPEMLVAVAGILNPKEKSGQLVIGGDPKQLGPVLQSNFAMEEGLGKSFLERMMSECELYKRDKAKNNYDPWVLTKLLQNYRSHPDILKLPSKLFYEDELEACGKKNVTHSLCNWSKLPRKGFPLIFHGTEGRDMREENSPSFFNPEEVMQVVEYIQHLLNDRTIQPRVKPEEIGIISPYRKQVQKLRIMVHKNRWEGMTIGSTEEFQGQERRIIIISTVRSSPEWLSMDKKHVLGFLCNPKRFNVAITRAKALLIIVGNPHILKNDENWNAFLDYCIQNKAYVGCKMIKEPMVIRANKILKRCDEMKFGPPK